MWCSVSCHGIKHNPTPKKNLAGRKHKPPPRNVATDHQQHGMLGCWSALLHLLTAGTNIMDQLNKQMRQTEPTLEDFILWSKDIQNKSGQGIGLDMTKDRAFHSFLAPLQLWWQISGNSCHNNMWSQEKGPHSTSCGPCTLWVGTPRKAWFVLWLVVWGVQSTPKLYKYTSGW